MAASLCNETPNDLSQPGKFIFSEEDYVVDSNQWSETMKFKCSKFDNQLRSRWDYAVKNGYFRYTLDSLKTRIIDGDLKYVAQLNMKRATERRKPQVIKSVSQPFNPDLFNFLKIKKQEILLELCPQQITDGEVAIATNGDEDTMLSDTHIIIINVSPLEYCNVLLVPSVESCLPQVLTQSGIELALKMLLISSHQGFRIGWNSLCAFASVNHLHFHAYYLDHELAIEYAVTKPVIGGCHEIVGYPTAGFAFQLEERNVEQLARDVYKVTSYFHQNEIAHNLFMTRGTLFGEDKYSNRRTVRVYVWPRRSSYGAKTEDSFNIAVCELAGHLPIKVESEYENMTQERASQLLREASLSEDEFQLIKSQLIKTFN
ncbi:GDP-D-glucose phosphorylase 1-like [Saccoglossus kowalevskii]|uniref:GDP-D-glucose phosphorylase 1 n=1 Tax=Saccoglossus kowalevskii TaxID=10224 RepID=A0ABM0GQP5_SACKO|nr:PREDICTED: GDP-D-glucose phosphorylase 1-like [Saccoglossus kowalevskii]